ncbi:hypothetical protein ACWV26_15010 [Rummeliibacillus sp. JY-2-4R]
MSIAWIAILPVVIIIVILASVFIYFVAKSNNKNSHKTIDPKIADNLNQYLKKEELK